MRSILFIAAAIGCAAVPNAARAAGDIGCIEARLGPAAIDRIGDRVVAASDAGASFDGALDLDREALIAARDMCRRANGWSNGATDLAVSYMKARASRAGADRAVRGDGLDPVALAGRYAALGAADRRSIGSAAITRPAIAAIRGAAGVTADAAVLTRRLHHITILFAALSAIEFYPGEFAVQ